MQDQLVEKELMTAQLIGSRLRALRVERGLSQEQLAELFGFNDRQTVSAIETGIRGVAASELIQIVNKLNVPLDYFTDPFRLDGEGVFSWRQMGVGQIELGSYERTAGQWLGAYRSLAEQVGQRTPLMRRTLAISKHSSFEEAAHSGERFAEEFGLGSIPSQQLAKVMQDKFGILVLMVDGYQGISGAACRLPEFDAVLIARGEVLGHRNFDLAHELFHILTWDAMPPKHVEEAADHGGNRVEQLANSFASALLMPRAALESQDWTQLDVEDLIAGLNRTADELGVTSSALRWRLVALKELAKSVARSIPESTLRNNGRQVSPDLPPLFSKPFAEVFARAIDEGYVSVRRASSVVGLAVEDLQQLFSDHGIDYRIEL